jgi:hypothetical protein
MKKKEKVICRNYPIPQSINHSITQSLNQSLNQSINSKKVTLSENKSIIFDAATRLSNRGGERLLQIRNLIKA